MLALSQIYENYFPVTSPAVNLSGAESNTFVQSNVAPYRYHIQKIIINLVAVQSCFGISIPCKFKFNCFRRKSGLFKKQTYRGKKDQIEYKKISGSL
jgi:hypothetical protein